MSARFVFRPFTPESMTEIGDEVILTVVKPRIARGTNVDDMAAKPLKPGRVVNGKQLRGYPDYKVARGLQPFRDLVWRGMTMRSMHVVSATANQVRIGFDNPQAARIAAFNQRRDSMFWFSPTDFEKIGEIVRGKMRMVTVIENTNTGAKTVLSRSIA